MGDKDRYQRGAHTVTSFTYHFVWKTKYGHSVLKGKIGLRLRDMIREICAQNKMFIVKGNVRPKSCSRTHRSSIASVSSENATNAKGQEFLSVAT